MSSTIRVVAAEYIDNAIHLLLTIWLRLGRGRNARLDRALTH